MKKIVVISVIVILLSAAAFFVYKKVSDVKKIEIQGFSVKIKIENIGDVLKVVKEILTNGVTAECVAEIYNFSNSSFSIDSLKIDLFNDEIQMSRQSETVSNISIKPGKNTIRIPVVISSIGLRSLNINLLNALEIVRNYYQTGKIGKTLTAKGFVEYHGITININETVNI